MRKVILSADSACDLGPELIKKYDVQLFYYHIQYENSSYQDITEITPDDIYEKWYQEAVLPKTAAVTLNDFTEQFGKWVADGYDVLHFSLGSSLSSSHQNACVAAAETGHVWCIDSKSLSTGIGLLIIKAGEMIAAGESAEAICTKLTPLIPHVHASFIVDTLEFLKAGGRCSSLTALGAQLLNIKPCIEVHPEEDGKMLVGKKYRGSVEKVLPKYIREKLDQYDNIDKSCIFITHSGSPDSDIALVNQELMYHGWSGDIHITRAGSTISSHCGPRTLGILFMTKDS